MNKQIAALATDEGHVVMWDMDAVLSDYKDRPYITMDTKHLIPRSWLTIDPQYAMTTKVDTPIIVFELPDDQWYIADGNHRLYRAAAENIQQMRVIVLPQQVHLRYLFRSTVEDYRSVIPGLREEGIFISGIPCIQDETTV